MCFSTLGKVAFHHTEQHKIEQFVKWNSEVGENNFAVKHPKCVAHKYDIKSRFIMAGIETELKTMCWMCWNPVKWFVKTIKGPEMLEHKSTKSKMCWGNPKQSLLRIKGRAAGIRESHHHIKSSVKSRFENSVRYCGSCTVACRKETFFFLLLLPIFLICCGIPWRFSLKNSSEVEQPWITKKCWIHQLLSQILRLGLGVGRPTYQIIPSVFDNLAVRPND